MSPRRDRADFPGRAVASSTSFDVFRPARTKLRPPTLPDGTLRRTTLLEELRTSVDRHGTTLVSAPAGYGKTTLLGQFAGRTEQRELGWVTLDAGDQDPIRLVGTLLGALREVRPRIGSQVRTLLVDHPDRVREAPDRLVHVFINEVIESVAEPLILVCEDLHVLGDSDARSALETLIEYLPDSLALVLSTRTDLELPLARWRVRTGLGEIRTSDLRFSKRQAATVLGQELGRQVDRSALDRVHRITEGWPAGIQLWATSLRQLDRSSPLPCPPASLEEGRNRVFDYLAREVLEHVEPEVRSFLLRCSILEELRPEVCAAVTERDDAGDLLRRVHRRNLFLLSVESDLGNRARGEDGGRDESRSDRVYRFHPLFREFLRHRLEEAYEESEIRRLHARAGTAEQVPDRRVEHLIRGRVWEEALDLLKDAGERLARRGAYDRVERWLDAFPSAFEGDGRYEYVRGVCALCASEYDRAKDALTRAADDFRESGGEEEIGRAEAHLATVTLVRDEMEAAEIHIARAVDRPVPVQTKVQLLMGRARAKSVRREWRSAREDLNRAAELARRADSKPAVGALLGHLHVVFAALPGGIEYFEEVARLAGGHLEEPSLSRLALLSQQAFVDIVRGNVDRSRERCREGFSLLETYRFGTLFMASGLMVANLSTCLAEDRLEEADRQLEEYTRLFREAGIPDRVVPGLFYFLGRVAFQTGDTGRLREAKARIVPAVREDELPGAPVLHAMVEGLLAMAEQEYADAERSLMRAREMERERRLSMVFGEATPLLAHLRHLRREETLTRLMDDWLGRCERRGTPGYVLREGELAVPLLRHAARHSNHREYARYILDRAGHRRALTRIVVPETGEELTERESEVLALIEEGNTNGQIADELHISTSTVKTHVSNILAKLDVHSRTRAAARARELRTTERPTGSS